MSTLSLNSTGSQNEDWDRSESEIQTDQSAHNPMTTPRNSIVFPADEVERTPGRGVASKGGRTLSELLKLHAEAGTEGRFSQEEASRVAEVLGQWINSESSPYEAEDDFFTRSQDDSSLMIGRLPYSSLSPNGRPRGQSEGMINSRPGSATGVKA
jgi:hypothetical protein